MVGLGIPLRATIASLSLLVWLIPIPVCAQIIPDSTLPEPSRVTLDGDTLEITNGTIAGSNLFHSFSQFDLPATAIAEFAQDTPIDNIIARVTSDRGTTIDGLLRANGTANLYLLSPAGLTFGESARLELGGSFVGSTATGLLFADGGVFSAVNSAVTDSVLSVNVPIGLQLGSEIERAGLAPIGLTGSELVAPGRVVLGGGTIALDQAAIVQGSGVEIIGSSLDVLGGSRIQSIVSDPLEAEVAEASIRLDLSDRVTIAGFTADGQYSGIFSQTTGSAIGGDIITIAPEVTLRDRGFIATQTTGLGDGGAIGLDVDRLTLSHGGQILSEAIASGNAGAIAIRARDAVTIDGRSDRFRVSPFANLPSAYDLTGLEFTTDLDPNIEAADTIPHLSLARTTTDIRSGDTRLATAQDAVFDYYIFAIDTPQQPRHF
ncbi:MAG: filamentous hemagglutinin N-terminal domain-containing protein [Coleofasciculaceae cyanobacterium RL_1_1]|nr:filamentous hemagglutinin N-terminal domain-containing protein [Coleofasciculaceae cyanobacterium RL_1_1]